MIPPTNAPEQLFYDRKGIRVTDHAVRVHSDSYPLSTIVRVEIESEKPTLSDRLKPILLIAAGILLLVLVIGIFLIIVGVKWWFSLPSYYWLIIETQSGKRSRLSRFSNEKSAEELRSALASAITRNRIYD